MLYLFNSVSRLMSENLNNLVTTLGITRDKAMKVPSGGSPLYHSFEVDPRDFLEQAEQDFEAGGKSALLNSITNSKRAIHCQVDQALRSLGIDTGQMHLPQKVELLTSMGFVVPRILKKVNRARNLLEHEYQTPDEATVEEALDLALLFIETTNRRLDIFEDEFYIGNKDEKISTFKFERQLEFSMDRPRRTEFDHPVFVARGRIDRTDGEKIAGKVVLKPENKLFKDIVRLVNARDQKYHIQKALDSFFDTLGL